MGTRIEQTDLARDALYTKVNQIADEKFDVENVDTDTNLGNSDGVVPSQKAVKTYVDNIDSNVVHLAEDETITGVKTFTQAGTDASIVQSTTLTTDGAYVDLIQNINNNRRGTLRTMYNSSDNSYTVTLGCNGPNASSPSGINIKRTASAVTVTAPTPATSDNSTNVATTAYVKNQGYVDTSNAQTVGGEKTFTSNLFIHKGYPAIRLRNSNITRGTNPSSTQSSTIEFCDKNTSCFASMLSSITSSGDCFIRIEAFPSSGGTTGQTGIYIRNYHDSTRAVYPVTNNNTSLGIGNVKWKDIYASTSTISTSDERLKQNIEAIPDEVLDAWGEVNFYQFKFKDSVAEKGENARLHTGLIAQRIRDVFESHNLDAFKYGLLCYDEWEESGEGGSAGNVYSLRYEECLCMEAAYQRRRADIIERRLAALEERFE